MTNAAFAFMCAGAIALVGVCAVSSGAWPILLSGAAFATGIIVYAKGW